MKGYGWLGFLVGGIATACSTGQAVVEPNVLLILTDDQGWGDFGFNGNEVVRTPVLDSLCERSAHLTNFYVSPLSASTRAGILTGRDHLRTGAMFVTRSSENMDSEEQTIAEVFRSNDYATGCFGKWHNGAHYPQDPNGQGFDEFVGFCAGHLTNYFDSRLQHNQEFFNAEGYITDLLTDRAIEFIDSSAEAQKPFFCYVPYNAPHAPYQVPDEYYDKYSSLDSVTASVYAMCECVDYNVGRLLTHLTAKGLDENTIIIFMSDNGPNDHRYNGVLRGKKGEMHEGGFKVPCLIYWRGRIEVMELSQTTSYVDVMPTIIELCGLDYQPQNERNFTGVSLKGVLTGEESQLANRYLFTHRSVTDVNLNPYNGVVYNDRYKLITFANVEHELYDKHVDPSEQNNLVDREFAIADSMISIYDSWFADVKPDYKRSVSRTAHIGLLDTPIELPTHEALMSGTTRYYTNIHGWAGDWMVDMSSDDKIYWDVIVDTEGDYQVTLQYSSTQQPHKVSLNGGDAVALESYKPTKIESPDRSPRVEAYEQMWGTQRLGVVHLCKGEGKIELKFNDNDTIDRGSLEVKGIEILKL
ncbi:MAG: arylsulfatase [Rikenellaceae bacterium]